MFTITDREEPAPVLLQESQTQAVSPPEQLQVNPPRLQLIGHCEGQPQTAPVSKDMHSAPSSDS